MEFPISPQPSPPGPSLCIHHIHNIIQRLARHRLGDAFEALLDLGDEMHDMADEFWTLGDLHQVNRLLTSIVHHSAYGIYEHVDQVIHRLLLLAIHTCDRLRKAQTQPSPDRVVWLSSTHSEINDHLDLYRNFLSHITSYPNLPLSRQQDPNLQSASQLLQKLRPRINGLSHWARPAEVRAKADAVRRRTLRPSTQRQRSGIITKPSSPPQPQPRRSQKPAPAVFLPTPPSQSGDVGWAATVSTMPVPCPGRVRVDDPVAPGGGGPPSHTMGRDDGCRPEMGVVDGLVDGMARVLVSPAASVGGDGRREIRMRCTGGGKAAYPRMVEDGVASPTWNGRGVSMDAFRLRPEHSCSPRCCPVWGR